MESPNGNLKSIMPPILETNHIKEQFGLLSVNEQPKFDYNDADVENDANDNDHEEHESKYNRKRKKKFDDHYEPPLVCLTKSLINTYRTCRPGNFHYIKSLQNPRRILTRDPQPGGNFGFDNRQGDMILVVGDIISNPMTGQKFKIIDMLGQGTFGQVVKCRTLNQINLQNQGSQHSGEKIQNTQEEPRTPSMVAIKVVKNRPAYTNQAKVEIRILEKLIRAYEKSDPSKKHYHDHVIHMLDSFQYHAHMCMVFDLMSINLFELIKQNDFRGLTIREISSFASQILAAMKVLSDLQIVHCDIKPENILIENFSNPPRIKLVDFGSACFENNTLYTYIQSRFYRAPEVILGLPYSKSIDVWSFGCIMVELYMGIPVFPGVSNHNQLLRIEEMIGEFPDWMLESGKQVKKFYNRITVIENEPSSSPPTDDENNSMLVTTKRDQVMRCRDGSFGIGPDEAVLVIDNDDSLDALLDDSMQLPRHENKNLPYPREQRVRKKWIIKSAEEYAFDENLTSVEKMKRYCRERTLHDIVMKCESKRRPKGESPSESDRNVLRSFLSFINSLLVLDPQKRYTVDDAISHSFISSPTMTDNVSPMRKASSFFMNSPGSPGLNPSSSFINSPFSPPARPLVPYPLAHDWTTDDSLYSYNPFFKEAEDPRIGIDSDLSYPGINYLGESAYFQGNEENQLPLPSIYDQNLSQPEMSLRNGNSIISSSLPNKVHILGISHPETNKVTLKRTSSDGDVGGGTAEMTIGKGRSLARYSTSELGVGASVARCLFGSGSTKHPTSMELDKIAVPLPSAANSNLSDNSKVPSNTGLNSKLIPKSGLENDKLPEDTDTNSSASRNDMLFSNYSFSGGTNNDNPFMLSPNIRKARASGEFTRRLSLSGITNQGIDILPPPIDNFHRSFSLGSSNRKRTSAFSRVIPSGSGCFTSNASPTGSPARTKLKTLRTESIESGISDFSSLSSPTFSLSSSITTSTNSFSNDGKSLVKSPSNSNEGVNVRNEPIYRKIIQKNDQSQPETTAVDCFLVTYIGNGETMEITTP